VTFQDRVPTGSRPGWTKDPSAIAEALVDRSIRRPWLVIALFAVLSLLGLYVTVTRFAITTDTDKLLQADSNWLRDKAAYIEAFPHLADVIVAVVDGDTPEAADAAASKLSDALTASPGPAIRKVWRPDGGPFFDRNGLLLLPLDQVKATLEQVQGQQLTLLALSGDPTLRGLLRLLQLGAARGALNDNAAMVDRVAEVVERSAKGERAQFSWEALMGGGGPDGPRLRRFVLVDPILNFGALEPAAEATARIRKVAADLGLTPDSGVRVRLTGIAPLADEEFATIKDGAPLHLGLTVVAIAVILYFALKAGSVIFAVLVTTFAGLILTIGVGLLMVGRFNVISVAVAALFLGLGVDFGIQLAVRYRDERHKLDDVKGALRIAARGIGWSLTLAAASLLAGFFAFLPTSFKGVSELGLITGVGMIIAFLASLTLLPALIAVLNPPGEPETVEMPALAAVDRWILRNRKLVIVASTAIVVAGLPFLFKLEFDSNPMHLRSEDTEAVATFLDLTRTPGMTPNTIGVLAPSLDGARDLAGRLSRLPEVAQVITIATFVPENQDEKLAAIRETASRFTALTNAQPPAPAPSDAELVAALRATAETLRGQGATDTTRRLAAGLEALAASTPERRAAAQAALTGGLPQLFERLRNLLNPERITLQSLPASLRDDWLSRDGRARVEVSPKGDANNNEVLERFAAAVSKMAPNVTGAPIDVVESRAIIVRAFVTAGVLALIAVFGILTLALRRPRDVALTLGPLVLATVMTLEAAYLLGMPLNLANIIALPLMLAVGVNFHIYYMIAWRDGVVDMLASSLTRAIFFSSLTTGVAFGSLWLSHHPGTASMGKLLTVSLFFTLLAAFIIVPAFLGPPEEHAKAPSKAG
jgi:hopanoid biosynthesis associated RND transporter like protein HpnN